MTDDKQRAERIAKKLDEIELNAFPNMLVKDEAIIAKKVGPLIRETYGIEAELGHYKIAMAAYELGRRETVEECAPKWISVEERLPAKGEMALVAWSDGQIEIDWILPGGSWYAIPAKDSIRITHWMLLEEIRALLPAATKETPK